jgi:hypothetical protein
MLHFCCWLHSDKFNHSVTAIKRLFLNVSATLISHHKINLTLKRVEVITGRSSPDKHDVLN